MYRVQVLLSNREWKDKSGLYSDLNQAKEYEKELLDKGWYTRIVDESDWPCLKPDDYSQADLDSTPQVR